MKGKVDRLSATSSLMHGRRNAARAVEVGNHALLQHCYFYLQYLLFLLGSTLYLPVCMSIFPFTLFILGSLKQSKMIIWCGYT